MLTKKTSSVVLIAVILGSTGCNRTRPADPFISYSDSNTVSIRLSGKETERAGIKFGSISEVMTDQWTSCPGYLVFPEENLIHVSAPAPGIVRFVNCSDQEYVEAGTVLANLESIEFLKLKQEYLEAKNQLEYLHEEYRRQGELTIENATSVKKMQAARRDFQSADIKMNALQSQLETYGIIADSLRFDHLTPLIPVIAPVSGYISDMNIRQGSYAVIGEELMVICKSRRVMVKLKAPEQILPFLKKDQPVEFFVGRDSLSAYKAKLLSPAHKIDPESHTADIFARITEKNVDFLPGRSVHVKIKVSAGVVQVTHSGAILHHSGGDFLFIMDDGFFSRIPVTTGNSYGELTELVDFPSYLSADSIVIQGGKYLNTLLEKQ